ncbi:MAG: uroporphyrinogen decarboxylase family protein [Candidatus Rokuibacteriota bacterium]
MDRPPFTIWYHFGLQYAPAERTAQAHLEFLDTYHLDWLKVMNDYSYPMPAGVETLSDARDLTRLTPLDVTAGPMGEQLKVVEILAHALRGRALFVDTVFNAWNTLRRNIVKGAMERFMRDHANEVEAALAVVNDNLRRYALASLARGAAGIFLSVPATAESVTLEQYERFMRPFDLELLESLRGRGECHILHAHGTQLHFDRLLDYPVHALSWGDRDGGPSLAEARRRTSLALVGGINHTDFPSLAAIEIRELIQTAVAEAGREKLLLAPGCAVPTYSFPELIRAARDAATRV